MASDTAGRPRNGAYSMSIWYAIPSARPVEEVAVRLIQWERKGYKLWLLRDSPKDESAFKAECSLGDALGAQITFAPQYPGYAAAVNQLCKQVMDHDPEAEWIVTGGDDISPDRSA